MPTLAELVVKIGADVAGFDSAVRGVNRKARDIGNDLKTIGTGLTAAVTVPLVGIGAAALKAAGDFEQTTIAFETMLGSGEKAHKFLKELEAFAKGTPFEFTDLTVASKRLLAMGFSAEQLIPTMTAVGNAVAGIGGGQESINRVTTALGQMQAKGKVSAEEMKQLTEAGIPAWEILAKTIGTDVSGAMDLVQKRAVDSGDAIAGLIEGMNQKFGGLMEAQSRTILGQFSNLQDQLGFILRDLGAVLAPAAQDMLNGLMPVVEELGNLTAAMKEAEPSTQRMVTGLGLAAAAAGPILLALGQLVNLASSSGRGLTTLATTLKAAATGVFAKFALAVGAIVAQVWALQKAAEAVVRPLAGLVGIDFDKKMADNRRELDEFLKSLGLVSAEAAEAKTDYSDLVRGSEEYLASLEAANLGMVTTKTAAGDMSGALREVDSWLSEMAKKADEAARKAQDLGEELQVMNDNALHSLKQSLKEAVADTEAFGHQIDWLGGIAINVTPEVGQLEGALKDVLDIQNQLPQSVKDYGEELKKAKPQLNQVSTAITDLSGKLADAIVNLGGFKDAFVSVGETIIRRVIEEAIKPLIDQLVNFLMPAINKVTSALGGLFGFGGGGGSTSSVSFPHVGGGSPGGGGAASAANPYLQLAQIGLQVFDLFMGAKRETTLNAIEESTRRTDIVIEKELPIQSENLVYITGNTDQIKVHAWRQTDALEAIASRLEAGLVIGGGNLDSVDAFGPEAEAALENGVREGLTRGRGMRQPTFPNFPDGTLGMRPEDFQPGRGRGGFRGDIRRFDLGETAFGGFGTTGPEGAGLRTDNTRGEPTGALAERWRELREFAEQTQAGAMFGAVGSNFNRIAGEAFMSLVGIAGEIRDAISPALPDLTTEVINQTTPLASMDEKLSNLQFVLDELRSLNNALGSMELSSRIEGNDLVFIVTAGQAKQSALA